MNNIDVLEGVVKEIISQFYHVFTEDNLDDTEYIRNIKAVINAVDSFLSKNMALANDPDIVKKVLYDYSKNLWLDSPAGEGETQQTANTENDGYNEYYFDYVYDHDVYPR